MTRAGFVEAIERIVTKSGNPKPLLDVVQSNGTKFIVAILAEYTAHIAALDLGDETKLVYISIASITSIQQC